ncbi:FkbM family methyltransferase [Mesorhizobium sp. 10J20-29]
MFGSPFRYLSSGLSRWNRRRKRFFKSLKLQRRFLRSIRPRDASSEAQVAQALAMLRPEAIDTRLVRIGPDRDGGYLVPDDLDAISALFSPGVSQEIGFDRAMAARGIECFLADASVEPPPNLPSNIHFRSNFIGPQDRPPFITLQDWVEQSAPGQSDLLLQMDIEGAEYDVLVDLSEQLLARFRIIVLELHDLHRLAEPAWRERFMATVSKLNAQHLLCHLHPNNYAEHFRFRGRTVPTVVELTYLRKDRAGRTGTTAQLPHPLDRPNEAKNPDIPHSPFWDAG